MRLITAPINIADKAWVCAGAFLARASSSAKALSPPLIPWSFATWTLGLSSGVILSRFIKTREIKGA